MKTLSLQLVEDNVTISARGGGTKMESEIKCVFYPKQILTSV